MLDLFRTWLPQIIGYAEAIQDGTIQRAWADGDRSRTSAYYSGELAEQVFGDLHADSMLADAQVALQAHPLVADALERFLASLKRLDAWIEAHVDTSEWGRGQAIPSAVSGIFVTTEWQEAQAAGATLTNAADDAGFSSRDFEPVS